MTLSNLADVVDILRSHEGSCVGSRRPGHVQHLYRSRKVLGDRAGRKYVLRVGENEWQGFRRGM